MEALSQHGASLLSSGIVQIRGEFDSGDAVIIRCAKGTRRIAKGVSRFSATELFSIKGQQSRDIPKYLGYCPAGSDAVIHRSEMMLLEKL